MSTAPQDDGDASADRWLDAPPAVVTNDQNRLLLPAHLTQYRKEIAWFDEDDFAKGRELLRHIDAQESEIAALWHFATCPYDTCERCIADEGTIKGIRDRMNNEERI